MEHGSSKTEKLIYRTSYLKHKQRLLDLRPHIDKPTTQQHARVNRTRQANSMREGDRQVQQLYSTEQMRLQGKRYEQGEEYKFEIKSDFNDGEPLRCVLPVGKMRANSFGSGQKNSAQQITKRNSLTNKFKSYVRSDKKFESFNVPRETDRSPPPLPQPQVYFNLPERNQNRQVIHKKTIILSPVQSSMLQLSLIGERLLIVGYLMGAENFTIKELLSLKRSKEILRDYADNFEELCCKITVQKINGKYATLKISENEEGNKEKVENTVSQDRAKLKAKVQNEFIKRNYYTILKNQDEKETIKEKPSVSKEKVQAIVDRLAVPRKYSKTSEQNTPVLPKPLKYLPPPVPYKKPFKSPAYPIYSQMNQISQLSQPLKHQFKLNKTEEDVRPNKKTQSKKTQQAELPSVHSKNSLNKSKSLVQSIHPKSQIPVEKQSHQQDAIDLPLLPREPADFNEFDESDKPEEHDEQEKFKQEQEQYEQQEQFENEGDLQDIERHQQENKQEEKYKLDDDEVQYLGQDYDEEFENPSTIKKSDLPNPKPLKTQLQPVKESGIYENSFEEDYQQDEFEASKPAASKAPQEDYAQSFEN